MTKDTKLFEELINTINSLHGKTQDIIAEDLAKRIQAYAKTEYYTRETMQLFIEVRNYLNLHTFGTSIDLTHLINNLNRHENGQCRGKNDK